MTKILHRNDTSINWTTVNPVLEAREIGIETDTLKFKIGNGSTAWNSLAYQGSNVDLSNYYTKTQTNALINNCIDKTEMVYPLRYNNKRSVSINEQTNTLRFNPIGFISSGVSYRYPEISDYQICVPTTDRNTNILDTTQVMYYSGDVKGNTIYVPNTYNSGLNAQVVIGKLDTNGLFTPYICCTEDRCFEFSLVNTSGMVIQGVPTTVYNGTLNDTSSISTTTSELTTNTISVGEGSNDTVQIIMSVQVNNDVSDNRNLITLDTSYTYSTFDANCIIFGILTGVNYPVSNFKIENSQLETIWTPVNSVLRYYQTLSIGNGLTVGTSGQLMTTLQSTGINQIITITQTEYDTLVNNSTVSNTTLYIITDTGAIYLGAVLIAEKN